VTAPDVPQADLAELAEGNTAFAFDLYQVLREGTEGNLFYSPYSVSLALAMTYAGARGETEATMSGALHFTLPQERLHPAFNGLDLALAGRGEGGPEQTRFQLNIANAIWGQEGYPFLPDFLDLLARNYGAGMRLMDFAMDAEQARLVINGWVEEQTEGRIRDLIPPGLVDAATRLVLTNAIYFNAAWANPFPEHQTADGAFHLLDGTKVAVPMMHQVEGMGYVEGKGFQAVELPYAGHELSMLILLPDRDAFEFFESSLDANRLETALEGMVRERVALTMPRFQFESEFRLNDALSALGMAQAFSGEADFSGMTGGRDLYISAVVHKAFVAVDEAGTEAAAATAVVMRESAVMAESIEVTLDRPFLFLIRDHETGTILFAGRVIDPR
jgi:serpin B